MNPEVKAKWVTALRSGKYEQGRDHLKAGDAFCCLGVLCDLYAQEHGVEFDSNLYHEGSEELPASNVVDWAGLAFNDPKLHIDGDKTWVSVHNDGGDNGRVRPKTFPQIADAIEEQL